MLHTFRAHPLLGPVGGASILRGPFGRFPGNGETALCCCCCCCWWWCCAPPPLPNPPRPPKPCPRPRIMPPRALGPPGAPGGLGISVEATRFRRAGPDVRVACSACCDIVDGSRSLGSTCQRREEAIAKVSARGLGLPAFAFSVGSPPHRRSCSAIAAGSVPPLRRPRTIPKRCHRLLRPGCPGKASCCLRQRAVLIHLAAPVEAGALAAHAEPFDRIPARCRYPSCRYLHQKRAVRPGKARISSIKLFCIALSELDSPPRCRLTGVCYNGHFCQSFLLPIPRSAWGR